jgi:hypothetical protein
MSEISEENSEILVRYDLSLIPTAETGMTPINSKPFTRGPFEEVAPLNSLVATPKSTTHP